MSNGQLDREKKDFCRLEKLTKRVEKWCGMLLFSHFESFSRNTFENPHKW